MYITYILFSYKLGKFYVGHTDNLQRRLSQHNSGDSVFTKRGIPWKLIYVIESSNRAEAMKIENRIKGRGASRFLNDINFSNLLLIKYFGFVIEHRVSRQGGRVAGSDPAYIFLLSESIKLYNSEKIYFHI